MKLFETVAQHVRIHQKTIRPTQIEKLQDGFITIFSGAHGHVEVNKKVRVR